MDQFIDPFMDQFIDPFMDQWFLSKRPAFKAGFGQKCQKVSKLTPLVTPLMTTTTDTTVDTTVTPLCLTVPPWASV